METFDFPFHKWDVKYQIEGTRIQFGSSYTFASAPTGPSRRIFLLELEGIQWFADNSTEPKRNALRLLEFYERHKLHEEFIYHHPTLGETVVRFRQPLHIPKGITGGGGVVELVTIELEEQP